MGGHEGGGKMRDKLKGNPETVEIMKEMKAAREAVDEAKMKELRQKLGGEVGKPGAGEGPRGEIIQETDGRSSRLTR